MVSIKFFLNCCIKKSMYISINQYVYGVMEDLTLFKCQV